MTDPTQAYRDKMVEEQLRHRGVRDERVLQVMLELPRHRFVPDAPPEEAYEDRPLKIGLGQTISQPYMVGAMSEALQVKPGHRVLEIGTGSGYQAAILGRLAREVHSIERHPTLAEAATERLAQLGLQNVQVHCGDGTLGWPPAAPYDRILVTAGAPEPPKALLDQLKIGGMLLTPAGTQQLQRLIRIRRTEHGFEEKQGIECIFVPLIGEQGWSDAEEIG